MLSEDIQKGVRGSIPVNQAAAAAKVEHEKELNQNAYNAFVNSPGVMVSAEVFREGSVFEPDSKLPEIFLQTLETVDSILLSDNPVMMIVSEEIPAYFLDQKDLDSVIGMINNRTKTVFDER